MRKPRDNYMVRHEHADGDIQRRKDYFDGVISHHDYYMYAARDIGLESLSHVVLGIVGQDKNRLRVLAEQDPDLNIIQLPHWDARHGIVTRLAHQRGWRVWTLSDSVCILKAVARYICEDPLARELAEKFGEKFGEARCAATT